MSEELLPYYQQELSYIRELAGEFARDNPRIARRLRITDDTVDDPHVERLIEAFAFLTARIQRKLDDEFPELTDSLLEVLYPHFLSPLPSMAIAQMQFDVESLSDPVLLPSGLALETEPVENERCEYQSCYPVRLVPLRIVRATYQRHTRELPSIEQIAETASVLVLELEATSEDVDLRALLSEPIRFYLRGQREQSVALYELLFNDTLEVAARIGAGQYHESLAGPEALRPVGFESEEGALPYGARSLLAYRLLTEVFFFPEKFLFFDLDLSHAVPSGNGRTLEVFVYFREATESLERLVDAESFALGCTPVVNLFPRTAEPIRLDQTLSEYHVVADARRPDVTEIYSVDSVTAISPDRDVVEYRPFFGIEHGLPDDGAPVFYSTARRAQTGGDEGREVYLSLVDLAMQVAAPAVETVSVETTCFNRDLPNRLPFGGGHPEMRFVQAQEAVAKVVCLSAPTQTLRPPSGDRARWHLISHLSVNHLSISDDRHGAEVLKEILRLYTYMRRADGDRDDLERTSEVNTMIDGIRSVTSRRVSARVGGIRKALVQGIEITVLLAESAYTSTGVFLFSAVLERFLGIYATVNSFTRLVVRVEGKDGELRRWPARTGEKTLL